MKYRVYIPKFKFYVDGWFADVKQAIDTGMATGRAFNVEDEDYHIHATKGQYTEVATFQTFAKKMQKQS